MGGTGIAESNRRPLPVVIVVGIVRLEGSFLNGPGKNILYLLSFVISIGFFHL